MRDGSQIFARQEQIVDFGPVAPYLCVEHNLTPKNHLGFDAAMRSGTVRQVRFLQWLPGCDQFQGQPFALEFVEVRSEGGLEAGFVDDRNQRCRLLRISGLHPPRTRGVRSPQHLEGMTTARGRREPRRPGRTHQTEAKRQSVSVQLEQTLATPARLGTRVEVDVNVGPVDGEGSFVRGLGRIHAKAVTGDQHLRVGEQIAGDRLAIDFQRLKSPSALEQVLLHLRL